MAAPFKLGDKVRSQGGVEGEIVRLNDDRRSVMVRVPGEWSGPGTVSIPVVRLRRIAEYASEHSERRPSCSAAGNLVARVLA
jgi:hypothetical protein